MFSLGRSGDVLESYLQSLAKLKENVLTLFRNYHDLIEAKLDCDSGKLLSYNTQPFCNSLSDALNNIDELEAQLHVLESWFEMPSIQHSFYPDELDRVSEDAQCLIEIVQQFQAALRSVVSKQSLDSGLDSVCPQQLDSAPSNTPMAVDQQRPQQIPRDGALSEFAVSAECQNSASLGTPPKQIKQRQRIQDQGMQQQTAAVAGHVSCDRPFGQDIPDLGNLGQDMTASDSVLPPSQMQSSGMPPFTTMAPATATVVGYGHGLQPQSRIPASLRSALEMASCAADPALPYPQTPSSHSSFGATTVGSEPLPSDSMNVDLPAEKTHGMHLQQQLRHPHPSDYQFHPNMPGEHEPAAGGFNDVESPMALGMPTSLASVYRLFSAQRRWQKDATNRLANGSTDEATLVGGTGGGLGAAGPQPYLQPKPCNIRYNPRMYNGGVLPRLTFDDEPVRLPEYQPGDRWVPHRAHFGQNDYIDILGDGNLKPEDFYTGPTWALNARNEFQRVCNLLFDPAVVAWLEEYEPSRLQDLQKRHKFLYGE